MIKDIIFINYYKLIFSAKTARTFTSVMENQKLSALSKTKKLLLGPSFTYQTKSPYIQNAMNITKTNTVLNLKIVLFIC